MSEVEAGSQGQIGGDRRSQECTSTGQGQLPPRAWLRKARRLVVKIGTSSLVDAAGRLDSARLGELAQELAGVRQEGRELVLVSSGAVAAGMARLGLTERPHTLPGQQAAAAVGQGLLMHQYEQAFDRLGVVVAQVLLTREDVSGRERYLNSRHTFLQLLRWGCLPIVNENDTVAVEELCFGDNDTLSAWVATLIGADLLVILSDVEGLFSSDPHRDPTARLVSQVEEITPALEAVATGSGQPRLGRGGMQTKLEAARLATSCGTPVVIARSRPGAVSALLQGEPVGTLFVAQPVQSARKRWVVGHDRPRGRIWIDPGAVVALVREGKSLLPAGVVRCEGDFQRGDLVRVVDMLGQEVARGLVNYSQVDLQQIRGVRTDQIESILGRRDFDEVIHRDNLVLVGYHLAKEQIG